MLFSACLAVSVDDADDVVWLFVLEDGVMWWCEGSENSVDVGVPFLTRDVLRCRCLGSGRGVAELLVVVVLVLVLGGRYVVCVSGEPFVGVSD